jgi:hypothetical protein
MNNFFALLKSSAVAFVIEKVCKLSLDVALLSVELLSTDCEFCPQAASKKVNMIVSCRVIL